ncbi:hypothetical protein ACLOJK_009006 [Asimina triloba]
MGRGSLCHELRGRTITLGPGGNLGVYEHHKHERNILPNPEQVESVDYCCYPIKSDRGELFSVFTDIQEKPVDVYKLDDSEMVWKEMDEINFYGTKAYAKSNWVERDKCQADVEETPAIRSGEKKGVQLFSMKKSLLIQGVAGK